MGSYVRAWLRPLLVLALAACGGDGPASEAAGIQRSNTPVDGGAAPLYVLEATVILPAGNSAYAFTAPSLSAGEILEYGKARELGSRGAIYGRPGEGVFYVGSGERPEVTKFAAEPDGTFRELGKVSFQVYGLTSAQGYPDKVAIVSDTKAYMVHDQSLQVVVWNPKEMTVTGAISLAAQKRDGYNAFVSSKIFVREGRLFMGVSWQKLPDRTFYAPTSQVLVIDTNTDQVIGTHDVACTDTFVGSMTASKTIYFGSHVWRSLQRKAYGPDVEQPPCVIRIPPGTEVPEKIDVDMETLVGGRAAGQMVFVTDDVAYVRAWNDEGIGINKENYKENMNKARWRWMRWEKGAAAATEIPGEPLVAARGFVFDVDGKLYATDPSDDVKDTTFVEMSAGGLRRGLKIRGYPYGLLRVR